jgi:hypothetical protein
MKNTTEGQAWWRRVRRSVLIAFGLSTFAPACGVSPVPIPTAGDLDGKFSNEPGSGTGENGDESAPVDSSVDATIDAQDGLDGPDAGADGVDDAAAPSAKSSRQRGR